MANNAGSIASTHEAGVKKLQGLVDSNPSVEFVRLQWIDFTATVRTMVVTVRQALCLAAGGRAVNTASPLANAFLIDGSFHVVNAGAKDSLVPDWSTLTVCHYQPRHAAVMCCIDEQDRGFECCPRSILKRTESEMQEKYSMTFKVGVEVEFYLTKSPESTEPVKDVKTYCATDSLRGERLAVLEDAVRAIELAGIPVWKFHSELVAGLFEISTDPMTPLQVADALVYVREAIRASAAKHGLHATMHPQPFDKTHGVGQHMHISLPTTEKHDSFLAGVLSSVPAISAISMPNFDSWLRRDFAGGDWVGWDWENRTSCVRKIRDAHWEFRFVDCTANAYLTLAVILGVGMKAWGEGKEMKAKPMSEWSAKLDEEGRKESGVDKPVPRDLKDSIEALKSDENVKGVLGNELWERFFKYKEHEEQMMAGFTLQERRTMVTAIF